MEAIRTFWIENNVRSWKFVSSGLNCFSEAVVYTEDKWELNSDCSDLKSLKDYRRVFSREITPSSGTIMGDNPQKWL